MRRNFVTLDQLYRATLEEVYRSYEFRNSPRGQAEREIIGYSARIENPLARFCRHPRRKQNIVFNYAEALWYLSGKNDLEFIVHYAPTIARYSSDGVTLPGTGYGRRLFHFGTGNLNQIDRALEILSKDDADSKRVFLQIFDANENIYKTNPDVSCTVGLQLLLREGKLHMVAFMRANDAYVGLLGDIFSFTFLQEYVASALGCDVGAYSHHVGSIHIYDVNQQKVEELLHHQFIAPPSITPPRMPGGCNQALIDRVLAQEGLIRRGKASLDSLGKLDVDSYWIEILVLFWIYHAILEGKKIPEEAINGLHSLHRDLLMNRWGDLLRARDVERNGIRA